MKILIVGAGGVTSWLVQPLYKTFKCDIVVQDGDKLEHRNLDRQLFSENNIGEFKASALASLYPFINPVNSYFLGNENLAGFDWVLACVDNHSARLAIIRACDRDGVPCIIGANEYFDSQAYIYLPEWNGTRMDVRKRYPEIETDKSGSPVNCMGMAQESSPQLCLANFSTASFILRLLWEWTHNARESQYPEKFPIELRGTLYENSHITMETIRNAIR